MKLTAVLAAALVPAPTAGATDVTLKQADIVLVQGTTLLCLFDSDDKAGKLEVGCILTGSKGPLPRSWRTGLLVDGTVEQALEILGPLRR